MALNAGRSIAAACACCPRRARTVGVDTFIIPLATVGAHHAQTGRAHLSHYLKTAILSSSHRLEARSCLLEVATFDQRQRPLLRLALERRKITDRNSIEGDLLTVDNAREAKERAFDRDCPFPVFGLVDLGSNPDLATILLDGLAQTQVGICLCDAEDNIRYVNSAFRSAYVQCLREEPMTFVDALAAEIRTGRGINLGSMSLEEFIPRARARRRALAAPHCFYLDFTDGNWWQINEHKLGNGWLLVLATEISGLKNVERKLREDHLSALKASQTDFLTGLNNRRHGLDQAQSALDSFKSNRQPLTIALIDIDHFKRINDVYGHEVGDKVLVHFADVMLKGSGEHDQISRIGGEEFLLVMPETPASRARIKLNDLLQNFKPLDADDERETISFTASAGLAQAHHSECLTDLLHRADVALYEAKAKGRHRIELSPRRVRKPQDQGRPVLGEPVDIESRPRAESHDVCLAAKAG